jgi:glycosyltransferase involved in cell wall biosynthesis
MRIFDKADRIICVSRYEKARLASGRAGFDERKVVMIPNGIDIEEFKTSKAVTPSGDKRILYVGRLEKYKGIDWAIRVLPKLPDYIKLDIVGRGPYRKPLAKLVRSLGLQERVTFFEDLERSKLLLKYAEASLLVLLSTHEAFGIVVAEALAAGTPSIVAMGSALEDWVDNESCFGINYPIRIEELAKLIEKVIGKLVSRPTLPTWDDAVEHLIRTYQIL